WSARRSSTRACRTTRRPRSRAVSRARRNDPLSCSAVQPRRAYSGGARPPPRRPGPDHGLVDGGGARRGAGVGRSGRGHTGVDADGAGVGDDAEHLLRRRRLPAVDGTLLPGRRRLPSRVAPPRPHHRRERRGRGRRPGGRAQHPPTLPSTPYGPYRVRAGWSRHRVLHLERTLRVRALAPVLKRLPRLAARGIPVFLTGDFNSPSHLDWTAAVAKARQAVPYAVRWPASKALAGDGFRDSYRDVHPDPVADPGFTWSPGGPETQKHDFFDRIDWVLHAGPSTTVSSLLVGEKGNPQVDLAFHRPYPTD